MGVFSGLTGRGSGAAAESYSVCGIIKKKSYSPEERLFRKDADSLFIPLQNKNSSILFVFNRYYPIIY